MDEVEGLGSFIEVEEMTEDGDSEKIQEKLFEFLKTMGITDEDREQYGYDVLLWQKTHPVDKTSNQEYNYLYDHFGRKAEDTERLQGRFLRFSLATFWQQKVAPKLRAKKNLPEFIVSHSGNLQMPKKAMQIADLASLKF